MGRKSQKNPQFYTQNGHATPPPKRWGFSCFNIFASFLSLPFSAILFLLPLCSLTLSSLKVAPPNEVLGTEVCDPLVHTEEFFGPFGLKLEPELKNEFSGPSDPGVKKVKTDLKRSRKSKKRVEVSTFSILFRLRV